jgi:hypothetical protein
MREMSKFYYYVGKKLADLKKMYEKDTDENQSIDEGSEDIIDDSQMNDENARPKNSDKKKHRNKRTRNDQTTQETSEQSEENEHIDKDRFYDFSPEMF